MAQAPLSTAHSSVAVEDVSSNLASFSRHLRAENKAPSTITTYAKAVVQLRDYLVSAGMPSRVASIRREHVESFLIDLQEHGRRPATIAQRFRSLQQFFKWLASEGEIKISPMANMKPPHVPEEPPPVITEDEMRRLLAACAGPDFDQRRDTAIIRLFLDTGMRLAELSGLRLDDVDFDADTAIVMGKGRRPRACPFGRKTAQAIDRYLRVRGRHPANAEPWLWIGQRGRLTDTGVEQLVKRRAKEAGLTGVHPHLFRHTYAHEMLSAGMQEGDLMRLAGWKSRQMLSRYGASAADDRARKAYQSMSPGDKL
ncbi:MAG: integrase [Thermomicrobiales bacterium]|nr:MAG: integrase [Thermomicrobiales bacterium]